MADDVKRICLLGAESTGKTTLARSLAAAYGTVWNPEYGRPYTELGRDPDAPWTSAEFTHIARIQCWYEDCLAGSARRALFCDTDAFTTALFHEVYLGEPTHAFDDSSSAATTSSSSAASTCRGGMTGSGSSTSSGPGCTTATWSGRGRAGLRGCCSKGRRTRGCVRRAGRSTGCSQRAKPRRPAEAGHHGRDGGAGADRVPDTVFSSRNAEISQGLWSLRRALPRA